MAQINFNVGAIANDGTGEPLRQAFQEQQAMNTELYATKVDKVVGKQLSDNNYTDAEVVKLDGIEAGAEVNVQADWNQSDDTQDDYIKNKPTELFSSVGYFHYADLTTQTTPLSILSGVNKILNNDGEGAQTNTDQAPYGVSSVYNVLDNKFDFSQLSIGDTLNLRVDLLFTTTSANQKYLVFLRVGEGSDAEYDLPITNGHIKSVSSDNRIVGNEPFSIDYQQHIDNPAVLFIVSDDNATVKVNGFFINVVRKSVNIVDIVGGGAVDSVNGQTGVVVLDADDVGAQATLVSGTSIKTINGSSVLGSGDLTVGGSSQNLDETLTNGNNTEQSATLGGLEVLLPSPPLDIVGTVYNDNFNSPPLNAEFSTTLTLGAEYNITTNLLASPSFSGFTKSITLIRQQALDSWSQEIAFKPTAVGTTSYGVGLGIKSVNATAYPTSLIGQVFLHDAGDGLKGKIRLYKKEDTSEIISTSATGLAFSQNDNLSLEMKRELNVFTFTFKNLTLATQLVLTQTYALNDLVLTLPNTGQLKIYFFGGTYQVTNYKYNNLGFENGVVYIGDSITTGYNVANFSDAYISNVADTRNWNYFGGQADRSLEIKNALPQILQNNPKYAVVFIGTNDAAFAYSLATYKSNLQYIVDYLISNEITPFLITPVPLNSVNTSTYVTACLEVASDYGISVINAFALLKDSIGTGYNPIYDGDGVHPNALGHALIAETIKTDFPSVVTLYGEIEVFLRGLTSENSGVKTLVLKNDKLYLKSNIIPEYTDNANAKANGLLVGDNYRTGDILKIVH
jgi:lysophospholipase L1-like esterase